MRRAHSLSGIIERATPPPQPAQGLSQRLIRIAAATAEERLADPVTQFLRTVNQGIEIRDHLSRT